MAQVCPWNPPCATQPSSTETSTRRPSLQEIMDEALARQLYEADCQYLENEHATTTTLFDDLEVKASNRVLYSADSCTSDSDDEDEVPVFTMRPTTNATTTRVRPRRFDRPASVDGAGKGLNSLRESFRRWEKDERHGSGGGRVEGATFATQNGVLDTRTVRLLQKLINNGDLDEVHGCVQSGKEANVYFAVGTDPETMRARHLAVKIFKTTLSGFSNRKDYVLGDRRYDLAFHKKDKRRQINEWSEKEFRNLSRAAKCIRSPTPIAIKDHIVVMQFVGDGGDGLSAPTLKEVAASMTTSQLVHAYADLLAAMHALFHDAKLVHGDLSEYNVLYQKNRCWVIDFGQAVDQTHPGFLEYLRRDLETVHRFFTKYGLVHAAEAEADGLVGCLSVKEAFNWITGGSDREDVLAEYPRLKAMIHAKQ